MLNDLIGPTSLTVVFQPIFDIRESRPRLVAMEALTRGPRGTHFESPAVLFEYVRLKGAEVAADRRCVGNAFRRAAELPYVPLLSVNVHATTLERDAALTDFIAATADETGIDPSRVIIEIVEQSNYWHEARLRSTLRELRALGLRFAVDDLGFGTGNYRLILDSRPEYLKIDRHFVDGCASDPYRRALLKSIVQLGNDCGAEVIAEGIETEDDLAALRELGVAGGQGYLLGRPSPDPQFQTYNLAACIELSAAIQERSCS